MVSWCAFPAGSAFAAPDSHLEQILSEANLRQGKPLALSELYADQGNVEIAQSSSDLKRQEKFFFEAANNHHNLAIKYKNSSPNEYLAPARQYWTRYIEWYHEKNSGDAGKQTFQQSGAADRIHTAVESLVRLTADLVGNDELLNVINSGELDFAHFNNRVVDLWAVAILQCAGRNDSSCSCIESQKIFVEDVGVWLETFPLRKAQVKHFKSVLSNVSAIQCTTRTV